LVTPIDWKPEHPQVGVFGEVSGRQSLVTPIDWKPDLYLLCDRTSVEEVANPW
jgi:hypothetical protein